MIVDRYRGSAGYALAVACALCIAAALAFVSCGGGDDDADGDAAAKAQRPADAAQLPTTGPKAEIESTYEEYVDGMFHRDARAVCQTMTRSAQAKFGAGESCVSRFETVFSTQTLVLKRPYIAKLHVRGDEATARVKTRTSKQYPTHFAKQDGVWKISGGVGL